MATTINSNTTDGIIITPDLSGEIELQSDGVTKAKITSSGLTDSSGNSFGGVRNLIINGDMRIDQRNAGASVTITADTYTLDRWAAVQSQSSKYSVQQDTDAPNNSTNGLKVTSLSAYTVGASENFFVYQPIEGLNIASLGWGTANAKTVTLSFWVKSSLTGTFGGALRNSNDTRSYPFEYSISSANTWEQKSVTISGDTAGTWLTTNGVGIKLGFGLGVGTTRSGTAGSWASANYRSSTGATSVVGTSGATWQVSLIQLEVGDTATPFEHRPYDMELLRCQRYYQKSHAQGTTPGAATFGGNSPETCQQFWNSGNTGLAGQQFLLKADMRANPSATIYDYANNIGKVTGFAAGGAGTDNVTPNNIKAFHDKFTVLMYGVTYYGIGFAYTMDAEL